jgi:hypothetical protein
MDRFKRTVVSLGAVLSVGLFARATKSALDFADSIDKAAKVAGVTTTFLQEMRFAGDQLGISTKLVDEGFRRFGRRLGEFVNSGGGPAAKAIESLGISVRDMEGNFRGTSSKNQPLLHRHSATMPVQNWRCYWIRALPE